MKRLNNHLTVLVLLLCGLLLAACESNVGGEDPDLPEKKEPPVENHGQAHAISENLILKNAQLITGTLPQNTNLADLKIDKKTVNLWPGIKNRIRILNEDMVLINSILVHIHGTDSYYEVPVEAEESNDTLSVFYIDIDPDGLELPLDHNITIAPVGPDGQVIDTAGDSLHVDPPFDDTGGEEATPEKSKPALDKALFWIYTEINGVFENAPGFYETGSYETRGCCIDGKSETRCQNYDKVVVVNSQFSFIEEEVIKFHDDGSDRFIYQLERSFNDYDPKGTDFCTGRAGYKFRSSGAYTGGTYSMSPANGFETFYNIIIEDIDFTLDDALNLGYGPFTQVNAQNPDFEYYLGSRFYVERLNVEGSTILRVFDVVPPDGPEWYD